ncbi:MAG: VTT domain-containing protein [Planctomycetota bacterium]|nr:VTT domain-containing protein [Planctomycetota bacterium]
MTQIKNDFTSECRISASAKPISDNASVGGIARISPALSSRRFLVTLMLILTVLAVGICVRYLPDLEWVAEREDWLRSKLGSAPITCYVLGLVFYIGLSLIPGTAGKSIVFGWFFGFAAAFFLVEIGLTTAAVVSFLIGRFVVRRLLHRRWQIYLRWISKRFEQEGAFYLLWLRMAHAPFTLVNYGAGATNIPLTTFWWTTHVGILPGTMVYTFVGSRVPNIRTVAEQGVFAIVDPWLVVVLIAIAFFPLLFRSWFRTVRH